MNEGRVGLPKPNLFDVRPLPALRWAVSAPLSRALGVPIDSASNLIVLASMAHAASEGASGATCSTTGRRRPTRYADSYPAQRCVRPRQHRTR